ncbi:MAG: murein biosynthesis integral membrane protein MurJ [Candidatus Firestonebacteria bacterium]
MNQQTKHITRSVGILSAATGLSRILGYLRDSINAHLFGAGWVSDAFFAAYRIPNMLRDLLAEGALSSAFLPTFVDYLEKKGKEEAFRLASIVFSLLAIIFSAVILFGILLAPYIVKIMAPGFSPDAAALTVKLAKIMFPFIAFMGFASVFMGMLNSLKQFSIPALGPALGNLVMIGFGIYIMLFLKGVTAEKVVVIWSFGVLASGLAQVLLQLPVSYKHGFRFKMLFEFRHEGVLRMAGIMAPAIFSNSVGQINIVVVNTAIASLLGTAAVSYLYYGFRMMQLPLGIFGVAVATASFPLIAAHFSKNEIGELKATLSTAVKINLFMALPAMTGLVALSYPINALLFQHGQFTASDAGNAAVAASYYALGLPFAALTKIMVPTFFAMKDSKTPVKAGIIAVLANVVFSLLLMKPMGFAGLALASTLSSLVNLVIVYAAFRKKTGALDERGIFISFCRVLAASVIMGAACYFLAGYFKPVEVWGRALQVAVCVFSGIIIFILTAHLAGSKETETLLLELKKKFGARAPAETEK